jgi:hypothetical protein
MKSLYTENHRYTDQAISLGTETGNAVTEIFKKYIDLGYSPREVSYIMQQEIRDIELMEVLNTK